MQNHLDTSQHRSYTSMIQADPFGGGPTSHEYTTLNHNGSPGSEYLLIPTNNNSLPNNHNNHGGPHHHNNNHNNNNNNNNNAGGGHRLSEKPEVEKPKKQPPPNGKKTKGRVKIKMEFIDNKLRRYTTFSKRKTGIMKKAYELSTLTGTQVMLLVASETGHVYTFATRKLQPMITSEAGKALIQTCLNSPDPPIPGDSQRMSATGYEETELTYAADPNGSDHGESKVRLSSSPYTTQAQAMSLHHSPSIYGSPLNNNYHSNPAVPSSMMFPHSPSPTSNVLYHYPSDPQPPQCYPHGGMHSPTHLNHMPR